MTEKIQHFHEAIVFQKKIHLGMTRLWQQHGQSMVVPKGIPRKLISQMKKFAMAVCWGVFSDSSSCAFCGIIGQDTHCTPNIRESTR